MANNNFNLADYVTVAERIQEFKARFPDGSLQNLERPYVENINGKYFIVYSAAAYRTPDDPRPGIGFAWEPIPGPTSFTRDSELMNAETAAWGRAIVALGFATKGIASHEEVSNRMQQNDKPSPASKGKVATLVEQADKHAKLYNLDRMQQNDKPSPASKGKVATLVEQADIWQNADPWMKQVRDIVKERGGDLKKILQEELKDKAVKARNPVEAMTFWSLDNPQLDTDEARVEHFVGVFE